MDDCCQFNKARWDDLSRLGISYARPWLDLDETAARLRIDPGNLLGDLRRRDVLCLAAGGGQQSAAFALLGARVTVFDLSGCQLEKDAKTAAHYGLTIRAVQGDMRDLSVFPDRSFDLIYQPYSLNFVPDAALVFEAVSSAIREGGSYRLTFANPFVFGVWLEHWTELGYPLSRQYRDGPLNRSDPHWYVRIANDKTSALAPKEFLHTLGGVINGLIGRGFNICGLWEDNTGDFNSKPGTWRHFKAVAPPWLTVLCRYETKGPPR